MRTDCLIIGAGLAGATLGYLFRKAGRDVLLLEICDAQKKDKLCAGAMNNETMKLLTQIFGPDVEESLHPGRFSQLRTRIDDKEIRTDLQNMFLALPRKRLDDYVLCRCLETDGQLLCRVSVKAIDIAAGDAAGLIHPTLGAGIHYAIVSAQRLAEALLEGEDYEDILRPCTDNITKLAEKTIRMQFIKNLSIYVKGTPAEPLC